MLWVESFMASTAEPRMVQLGGGGAFAITKDIRPYQRYTPIADTACHC